MTHYMLPLHTSLHDPLHDPLHVSGIHYMADYTSHYMTNSIVHNMIHCIYYMAFFAPSAGSHSTPVHASHSWTTVPFTSWLWIIDCFDPHCRNRKLGLHRLPDVGGSRCLHHFEERLSIGLESWTERNLMCSNNHASSPCLVTNCGRTKAKIQ